MPTLTEVLDQLFSWGSGWRDQARAEKQRGDTLEEGLTAAQAALAAERAADAETDIAQAAQIRAEAADEAQAVLDRAKASDLPTPPDEEPPVTPGDVEPETPAETVEIPEGTDTGTPGAGTVVGDVSETGPVVDNPLGEPVEGSGTGQQ